jgi:tetratricopeptide (TPR) repeat protein
MKTIPPPAGHGVSPLASLRTDLGSRATTRDDDNAVALAAMLRHAAEFRDGPSARRTLRMAKRLARALLQPEDIREGPMYDETRRRGELAILRKAAEHTMRAHGNVTLAANMLDSLAALAPAESIEAGRILAQRGTALMFLGYTELATQQYRRLVRLGKKLQSRELIALGVGAIASRDFIVGNLPLAERSMRRAMRYTGPGLPRVTAMVCNQLGVVRAMRGDPDEGLALLWRAYRLTARYGTRTANSGVLGNITNLLLKTGHLEAARAAARSMLCMDLDRAQWLHAVARYANVSAGLGETAPLNWCVSQLLEHAETSTFPMATADALYECSLALERAGRLGTAARLRRRAHRLAVRHGYHELAHSAGEAPAAVPSKISRTTQAIVTEVRALEPGDEHLLAVTASAAQSNERRLALSGDRAG